MNEIALRPTADATAAYSVLAAAINALPAAQRTVLVLFYYERISLPEIAMLLDEDEDGIAADFYLAHEALALVPDRGGSFESRRQVA